MDALSAPVIAPAVPGGEAEAASPQGAEGSADFAALVAALLTPLPGLPVPVPVEDATAAPAQPVVEVVDLTIALAAPVVEGAVTPAVAPPTPEVPAAPVADAPMLDVAPEAAPVAEAAVEVPTPVVVDAVEAPVATPAETTVEAAQAPEAEVDVEAPETPAAPARAERAADDIARPVVAPEAVAVVEADAPAAVLPELADEPAPLPPSSASAVAAAPAPTLVDTPAPVAAPEAAAAAPHVQVAEAVGRVRHVDGTHEVTLELHPAELGPVKVTMTVDGSNVSLHLSAQHGATDDLLRRHLPDLRALLADAGLTATSVDVGGSAPQRHELGDGQDTPRSGDDPATGASSTATDVAPTDAPARTTGSSSTRLDVLL